jgi:NADPH:quinone reductase-like Zn-dependent oxidoreductase
MSGVVAAIGANVSDLKVGDAVYGLPAFDRDGSDFDNAAWPLLIFEFGPTLHV